MLEFILNENIVRTNSPPGMTLLDYIRYEANLRGTKIGCREGDCGACTVLLGTQDREQVQYASVTSCLTPLANAHGKHVVTIEGLNVDGLNQVQEAMVRHSGTQCGFCTPGFVTSLCGYALNCESANSQDATGSMDGNICRCTGYKSIERAAGEIAQLLELKEKDHATEWLIENNFVPAYFQEIPARLTRFSKHKVSNVGQAIGGGSDLFVHHQDRLQETELKFILQGKQAVGISFTDSECVIDASATASDLMHNERITSLFPGWYEFMKLVSSTPIRNIGTVAGNLVNASPIGDLTILLLSLNADIALTRAENSKRIIPLKSFYLGYKKLDKTEDELISEIRFKLPEADTQFHFEKVCKRKYLDIASVNTAIQLQMETSGIIKSVHASMGGVGPTPQYLQGTGSYLEGKKLNANTIKEAAGVLQEEIKPISDVRGSETYKRLLARQLFFSHFVALFPDSIQMEDLL